MDDRVNQDDLQKKDDEDPCFTSCIHQDSNFESLSYLQQTQQFFFKLRQTEKQKIESELVSYLQKLSDNYSKKFTYSLKMHQDFEIWMVSRVKFKCFQTIESMLEGNTNNTILRKMMSIIPIEYLKLNLLQVYSNFKVEDKCQYNMELFKESLTHNITDFEPEDIKVQKVTVIESGFKIYNLITKYENEQHGNNELNNDEDDDEDTLIKDVFGGTKEFFQPIFRGIKRLFLQNILREGEGSLKRNVELSQELHQQAMDFFKRYVCRIEIQRDDKIYSVHFPKLPYCVYLTDQTKDQFQEKVNRMSLNSKLRDLMIYCDDILDQLQNEYSMMKQYEKLFLFIYVAQNFEFFQNISFYLAFTQNVLILFTVDNNHSFDMSSDGIEEGSGTFNRLLFALQIIQVALGGMLAVFFTFKVIMLKVKKAQKFLKETEANRESKNILHKVYIYSKYILIDFYVVYYLAQSVIAIMGILNPIFSVVLLVDVFRKFPSAKQIIQSILKPWQQLLVILFIWLILTYSFSLLYYFNYYELYPESCSTLIKCHFMILDTTFKSDAGFLGNKMEDYESKKWEPNSKMISDFLYAFIVTILIIQIIQGIIIDTFALLRQQQEERVRDMETCCFICGRDRESLDKQGNASQVNQAIMLYQQFIKQTQQRDLIIMLKMLTTNGVIFSILPTYKISDLNHINIKNQPPTECTGLESYVRWCISSDETKIQWFPINRVQLEDNQSNNQNEQRDKLLDKKIDKISNQIIQINSKLENMHG